MIPPRQNSHAQPQSDAVAWRLLDMAYADPVALWAYLVFCIAIGGITVGCMRDVWSVGWAWCGVCLAVAGLVDRHSYPARRAAGRPILAQRRFMTISVLHGIYWGLANLVLLLSHDLHLQFWIINAETAVISLTVARLNPVAAAIRMEVALSIIPLVVCSLLTGNVYFQGYGILAVLYLLSTIAVIKDLNQQTVRMLVAEEDNAAMLQSEARTNARLEAANRRLDAIATTDGLTGIPNRRCFDDTIRNEWDRAERAGTGLAVLLVDIDKFKSYNDTLGHLAGDACLRRVAKSLAGAIRRPSDMVARYGGEEFAAIIPDADAVEIIDIAERVRAAVEEMALPSPSGAPVTVSIGAARCKPAFDPAAAHGEGAIHGIDVLIGEADANLYEAKRAGRNCVRATKSDRQDCPITIAATEGVPPRLGVGPF